MGSIASQITSLTIVYSIVYLDADQRKHQSSASLAFVKGIHRGPVNSLHKWPVTRKVFPFHDAIMFPRPPYSQPAYTTLVPKYEKHPFSRILDEKKTSLFQANSLILTSNKTTLFKQNAIFSNVRESTLFVKVRIYVTTSNSRHFSMYVVFFITSKIRLKPKCIYA